jgi:hypothetical protein
MSETIEPLIVRRDEARKLLGNMPLDTLKKITARREIPILKIGTAVYYDVADLRTWLESKKNPTFR